MITEKPSEDELNVKLVELKKEEMRVARNELLKDCDFRFVSDFPQSDGKKQEWIERFYFAFSFILNIICISGSTIWTG